MLTYLPLIIGFVLDSIIGDPYRLPHPIRLFGNIISYCEKKLNQGKNRRKKGAQMTIILVCITYVSFAVILHLLSQEKTIYIISSSILIFYGLANHSLIREALKVDYALRKKGLEAGRKQLSYIVGRDTSQLSPKQIRTAVLETLSENLSDGVIAPLFFFAIGGIPTMFAYKMVNTLDSMIGYKNDRYKDFGFFAAKLDDVVNFIPARITAFLIALISFSPRAIRYIFKYGSSHSSPNAGYPEAALAGVLNCRFGGPNVYYGKMVEKPYIGRHDREISSSDILKACIVNALVTILMVVIIVLALRYWELVSYRFWKFRLDSLLIFFFD